MYYEHERKEKKATYTGPRPHMPRSDSDLWPMMEDYLLGRWLRSDIARASGWYPAHYAGCARIIIPCTNTLGVPYFQGRDMGGKSTIRYASPPAPRDDSIVVVWPMNARRGTVVVEGPMDALAAAGEGYLGIGLMGNMPNSDVLDHVFTYAKMYAPLLILPDKDMLEMGPLVLCPMAQRGLVGTILMSQEKDLAAMVPSQRRAILGSVR